MPRGGLFESFLHQGDLDFKGEEQARILAILDLLFGRFEPTGLLPFELPSSMAAVEAQQEDVPYDSKNPLFPFGFGLRYHTLTTSP